MAPKTRGGPHHKYTITGTKQEHAELVVAAAHAGKTLGGWVAQMTSAYVKVHGLKVPVVSEAIEQTPKDRGNVRADTQTATKTASG